jgi:sugar phosphate isomerase/epimerase
MNRRAWFQATAAAGLAGVSVASRGAEPAKKTQFQIACMTLPYARFPLERALSGLQSAGYRYVAWGTMHASGSERVPTLANDASAAQARELAQRCRDLGLEPVLMFGPSPESVDALKTRIRQAAAAGVAQVLTMGTTKGNDPALWIKNFKELGPIARDHGVRIVVKQHGGNTGTGAALAEITRQVNDEGVKISYDAGNGSMSR